jgi:hypothetical protein
MEVVGKVKYKSGDIQVSASFKKSELVVTTDEQYPQHILIEFTQDKCDLVDPYQIGENVKVSINPQGETRYFNQIQGWKIERLQADARQTPPIPSAEAFAPATNYNEDEPDDLPF